MTARAVALAWLAIAAAELVAQQVIVPAGAVWRYADQGVLPAIDWMLPGYDDSAWSSGPAQLGYGDGDEATVVASGPIGSVHTTTWFRHTFSLIGGGMTAPRLRVLCDDGVVCYVNGIEVGRHNLHNGPVGPTSPASIAISGNNEGAWHGFVVDPSLLVGGTNVIACELHQVGPSTSDAIFACELLAGAGPAHVIRGPYLQNGTPSGGIVRWRTDLPTTTQLWLGSSPTTLAMVVSDPVLRRDHEARVTGLPADTTFHYAIGDAGGPFANQATATLRTLPPFGASRPLRLWVLGDAGWGWLPQYVVRDLYRQFATGRPADALLLLGDNAYPFGTDAEYQAGVFDVYGDELRRTFSWSTFGNHDAYSAASASQTGAYYDLFSLPTVGEAGGVPSGTEAWYSFDIGQVHFVCLDSNDSDRSPGGAMLTWLQADLAARTAPWLIAFFHHPPYSAGSHRSDDPLDSGGRMTDLRQNALPILEAAGVDLVLSGHSHGYERSRLIDGHYGTSSTLQPSMVLDRGDGRSLGDGSYHKPRPGPVPHQGTVYVVAGSAGWIGGGTMDHPAMQVSLVSLGSLVLDIDGDRLDASFVGLGGVEDSFTLEKGPPRALVREQPRISVVNGGRQDWQLAAGPQHAGRFYLIAGSTGTEPGLSLFGVDVPLNADPWLQLSLALANGGIYQNTIGVLDAGGRAGAALVLPPLVDPSLVVQVLWHAFVVGDGSGLVLASNAVKMTFGP